MIKDNFKYTSCNNEECIDKKTCKRYTMFKVYGATDIKKGGGNADHHCKRYLPMKG